MTTAASTPTQVTLERLLLKEEIEDFLYYEAELLDTRRLTEWTELLAEDIHYYVPFRRNVKFGDWDRENTDPAREISWFDEGKRTLMGRVRQINTGVHWAEEPVSRISHMVSNVRIEEIQGDELRVSSRILVYTNRLQDEVNIFVGKRYDTLRRDPDTVFKIAKRTVLLEQNTLLAKVITTFF